MHAHTFHSKLTLCMHEFVFSFCALQRKCEIYWPTNEARSEVRGPLRITYLDEEAFAFYTVRRFEVKPVDQKSHYCQVLSVTHPTIFSEINSSTRKYCAETFMWMVTLEDLIHILKSKYHLVKRVEQYHRKVLLRSFHLNGHNLGFRPRTKRKVFL